MDTAHEVQAVTRGLGLHFGGQPIAWHRAERLLLLHAVSMHAATPPAENARAGMLELHDPYEAECTELGGDGAS